MSYSDDYYQYNRIRGRGRGTRNTNRGRHHPQNFADYRQAPPQHQPPFQYHRPYPQQQAPYDQHAPQHTTQQQSRYWRPRGRGYNSKRSEYRSQTYHSAPNRRGRGRGHRAQTSQSANTTAQIAVFDIDNILKNDNAKSTEIQVKLKTYYHTDPVHSLLEFDDNTRPSLITAAGIESLRKVDLNSIPITYSTLRDNTCSENSTASSRPRSLREQRPPPSCWNITRVDPYCYEIVKIESTLKRESDDANEVADNEEKKEQKHNEENPNDEKEPQAITKGKSAKQDNARFITYRHNLRSIANVVLAKLGGMKMYDKTGISIAVHRKANDIFLENVAEIDDNKPMGRFDANMVYGFLLEHVLEEFSSQKQPQQHVQAATVTPMDYQSKCLERDEIRALNEIKFGEDIQVLCAAEMDAILSNNNDEDSFQVIEIKSSWINQRNARHIDGIPDAKLLKYWTQCRFGGVDAVLVALQTDGMIQRTQMIKTEEVEKLFPVITSKCVQMVHDVLQWLRATMMKLDESQLYLLSFDTKNWHNTKWTLRKLKVPLTEGDKKLNHGFVINPYTTRIETRTII